MTCFSLLARIFAIILYMLLMRHIGRKSPIESGSLIFGIKVRNEALQPIPNLPVLSKCLTTIIMSDFSIPQYVLKNLKEYPSGLGAFSHPQSQMTFFILFVVMGASSLVLSTGFKVEKFGLVSFGLDGHLSWNLCL